MFDRDFIGDMLDRMTALLFPVGGHVSFRSRSGKEVVGHITEYIGTFSAMDSPDVPYFRIQLKDGVYDAWYSELVTEDAEPRTK